MSKDKKFKGLAQDFIKSIKLQFIGQGADPNDIFVQDLYNFEPKNTTGSLFKRKNNMFAKLSTEDRKILESILKVYNDNITTKRELLTQSRQLYETSDVVHTIIDVMIDDGFNSFQNEKEEFRIFYDLDEEEKELLGEDFQENVQNIIDEFVDDFGLKTRIAEMVPELLRDGEYAFGVLFDEENKKGITEIVDDMDVANLLPFYEGDKLTFVIKQDQFDDRGSWFKHDAIKSNNFEIPQFYKPDNIIFFRLKGPKKKINLSNFYDEDFRKEFLKRTGIKLPKYVRIPKPIYASAMKNLNRLQIMMNVSTVLDLAGVLKPEIVTVQIPTNSNEEDAQEMIRNYERHLNDNGGLTDEDSLDISTLAAQANRRKVLPQWMEGKGVINQSGVGSTESGKNAAAWESIKNVSDLIALSVGIPPYYINMADRPEDKTQTIKLYSRYTRKLTGLQKSIAEGVKDIIILHLRKKGINVSRENLQVKFKAITSGDSLDDTDMMVATVTGINDLYKGIEEIVSSENNNFVLDDQQFKELFDNLTSKYLNISDLIKISDNKFNNQEFADEDSGFQPLGSPSGNRLSDEGAAIDAGFEDAGVSSEIDAANNDSYQDFVNADDGIELEEPQTITTEG